MKLHVFDPYVRLIKWTKILQWTSLDKLFKCTFTVYNTHQDATIYIEIVDVNDNTPRFWYLTPYPEQDKDTADKYFGHITQNAGSDTPVMSVFVCIHELL